MTSRLPTGLGVSSLAWNPSEDRDIAGLLQSRGVSYIDLVPTKYFGWEDASAVQKAFQIRGDWAEFGINIRGMQSLLFGAGPLNILHPEDWPNLIEHFERVFSVASALGANRLVFGSPNNRKRGSLDSVKAESIAAEFLGNLADQARDHACLVLLEPNPLEYGCDFVTTTSEAISLVRKVGHPNLRAQLDLGTCFYNNEQADDILQTSATSIGYIHLATKKLQPLQDDPNPQITKLLSVLPKGQPISIEMMGGDEMSNIGHVQGALDWVEQALSSLQQESGR
jgi:D-psicose/D-tagatose/L-ribulose 3-epimerase